jgi:hypothetical protein
MKKQIIMCLTTLIVTSYAHAEGKIKITKLSGEVIYNNKIVAVGAELDPGSELVVGKEESDFVEITYPEGHHLRLKKNAKLKITAPSLLNLLFGKLFVYYNKQNKNEPLRIRTSTAVVGVRGTKFLVEEDPKGSYYCVCDGVIEVTKDSITRQVKKDQDLWSRPGKPLGEPKTSPDMGKMTEKEFIEMGI